VVLGERLRANAAKTVAFFADQGVDLKMLSGDAPATAGRPRNGMFVSARPRAIRVAR
jgi:cation transport ATPase